MVDDPATSVVGPEGRMWDVDNVVIADSSVFATSTGYNPTLTIMAPAGRFARALVGDPLPVTAPATATATATATTTAPGSGWASP